MRKGEIACNKQFLIFSQRFPQLYIFSASKCGIMHFKMSSAICFKLDQFKILLSGNGLKGPGNSQYIFNTVVPLFQILFFFKSFPISLLLFTFNQVETFTFLPAANTWTNCTRTDCQVHNKFHTLKL